MHCTQLHACKSRQQVHASAQRPHRLSALATARRRDHAHALARKLLAGARPRQRRDGREQQPQALQRGLGAAAARQEGPELVAAGGRVVGWAVRRVAYSQGGKVPACTRCAHCIERAHAQRAAPPHLMIAAMRACCSPGTLCHSLRTLVSSMLAQKKHTSAFWAGSSSSRHASHACGCAAKPLSQALACCCASPPIPPYRAPMACARAAA